MSAPDADALSPGGIVRLREAEFPWAAAGRVCYLNNASTGPLPARALYATAAFNELRAIPHQVTDDLQFGTLDRCRSLIAGLIGATPREIALATNTGFGINLAARALPLRAGDVVLGFDGEFPANVYPWMQASRSRGFEYRRLPLVNGLPSTERLLEAIRDPRVRAVAVSWVAFASGCCIDLDAVGAACRSRGIYLVVDAIQGVGARRLDLRRTPVDILACGAQKWLLSPWGSGFTYVRDGLVRELDPHDVSWMAVRGSDDFGRLVDYDLTWREDARRFEQITLPYQDFAGAEASLSLLHEVGPAAIARRVAALADRIVQAVLACDRMQLITPADPARRAGVVAIRVSHPAETSERLTSAGIIHSLREGAIRLSPHFYNTEAEIDQGLAVLAA